MVYKVEYISDLDRRIMKIISRTHYRVFGEELELFGDDILYIMVDYNNHIESYCIAESSGVIFDGTHVSYLVSFRKGAGEELLSIFDNIYLEPLVIDELIEWYKSIGFTKEPSIGRKTYVSYKQASYEDDIEWYNYNKLLPPILNIHL